MVCTSSYASAGKFSFCHHDIGIAPSEEQGGAHQHRDYGALFLDMENIYVPPIQTSSSPKEFLSRESGELGKLWKLRRLIRMGARPVLPIAPPKRFRVKTDERPFTEYSSLGKRVNMRLNKN